MSAPPATASDRPSATPRESRSPSTSGAISATQSGVVVTSTTDCSTVVSASEAIQLEKCTARSPPAASASNRSPRDNPRSASRCRTSATGASTSVAIARRPAAMISESASRCANRTKIEAAETARMPPNRTTGVRSRRIGA